MSFFILWFEIYYKYYIINIHFLFFGKIITLQNIISEYSPIM